MAGFIWVDWPVGLTSLSSRSNDKKFCAENNIEVRIIAYADDFLLLYKTDKKITASVVKQIASSVRMIINKFQFFGFISQPEKTKYILFSRRYHATRITDDPIISMYKSVSDIKFLGVWFDQSWRFTRQINEIVSKVNRRKIFFRSILKILYKLPVNHINKIVETFVYPIITYAMQIWYGGATKTEKKRV